MATALKPRPMNIAVSPPDEILFAPAGQLPGANGAGFAPFVNASAPIASGVGDPNVQFGTRLVRRR
jgi:hypothetical protein